VNDRNFSAGVLGAIFLVTAMVFFLPQLETLQAWSVSVRLRQTLGEAEDILAKLRALSVASARISYSTVAWGNRMDGPKLREKQSLLDQVNQLTALNVSRQDKEFIRTPYVDLASYDLFYIFSGVVHALEYTKMTKLDGQIKGGDSSFIQNLKKFKELEAAWQAQRPRVTLNDDLGTENMRRVFSLEKAFPEFDAAEKATLGQFEEKVISALADIRQNGRMSDATIELMTRFQNEDTKKYGDEVDVPRGLFYRPVIRARHLAT
jgi:hypothetical protein